MDRNTENQQDYGILKTAIGAVAFFLTILSMSSIVMAQSTATVTGTVTGVEDTGLLLDAGIILTKEDSKVHSSGTLTVSDVGGTWTYNLTGVNTNITATIDAGQTAGAAIIVTNDSSGVFNLGSGTYRMNTSASQITGFLYADDTDFAGRINGTATINVTNTGNSNLGRATGVGFVNEAGTSWATLAESTYIEIGDITVEGGTTDNEDDQGVEGFAAGASSAEIHLGTIDVNGKGNAASGVYFGGNVGGTLETEAITVRGGDAFGIQIGNHKTDPNVPADLTGTITVDGNIQATAAGQAFGIVINGDVTGVIDAKNITATSSASSDGFAAGVRIFGDVEDKMTFGTITANGGNSLANGVAYGISIDGAIKGNIEAGNITANAGYMGSGGAAVGFVTGDTVDKDSKIELGNIIAYGYNADGVHFMKEVAGNVTTGTIGITALGEGRGVYATSINETGNISVGTVTVESGVANGYGIRVEGEANLTLRGNITVTGAGADTSGIRTGDVSKITLDNNVTLSTTSATTSTKNGADIWSGGNLTIDLKDKTLTTTGGGIGGTKVKVEGNLTVADTSTGAGSAKLGIIDLNGGTGSLNVQNKATVVLDINESKIGGGSIGNDATITLTTSKSVADFVEAYRGKDFYNFTGWTGYTREGAVDYLTNFSQYDWKWVGSILRFDGLKPLDPIARDGYLAALHMHRHYTAWNAVHDRLISGSGYGYRAGYYGQSACGGGGSFSDCTCSSRNAWVNYVRRDSTYNGNQDWELGTNGAQVGTDFLKTRREQIGMFFGYEEGRMRCPDSEAQEWIKAHDFYFGAYGAYVLNTGADLRGVFGFGKQEYSMQQYEKDYFYDSSFGGYTTESTVEIGQRVAMRVGSMRPVLAVDVITNNLKKSTLEDETESEVDSDDAEANPVIYKGTSLTQVFVRTGSDFRHQIGYLTLNSGLYYSYDLNGARPRTRLTNEIGQAGKLSGSKLGRSLLTFDGSGSWQLTRGFSAIGGYQGEYALDGASRGVQHTAQLGGLWRW